MAYYGVGWRHPHDCSGYLSASSRRAVNKRAARHISVSVLRAAPAPRLKRTATSAHRGAMQIPVFHRLRKTCWVFFFGFCGSISSWFHRFSWENKTASPEGIGPCHPCLNIPDTNTCPHSSAPSGNVLR